MADKELEVWLALGLGIPLLLLVWVYYHSLMLQQTRLTSQGGAACKVPPGKLWQLPLFGESIPFLTGSADSFLRPRIKKYGRVFTTHLLGGPAICVTSVDAVKFIFQSPSLFKARQAASLATLLGDRHVNSVEGDHHARYRKIIRAPITSAALEGLIAFVDQQAKQFCLDKGDQAVIHGYSEFLRFTMRVAMHATFDHVKVETDELLHHFKTLESGMIGFPVNLPGTAFGKALKARDKIRQFLHQQIQIRRQEKGSVIHNDLLDSFLQSQASDGGKLTDEEVVENLQIFLIGGHETSSSIMSWTYRNLFLNPKILQLVKDENDAVARARKHADDPITWQELQKLELSTNCIRETMRLANPLGFVWRQAAEDVVYDGKLFPKGWLIYLWMRPVHLDSEYHVNPLEFNPWRHASATALVPRVNAFLPFGNGTRLCPGKDLAMTEMLIFLHRFLTTYDFEAVGDLSSTKTWPLNLLKDGLPLRIWKRSAKAEQARPADSPF